MKAKSYLLALLSVLSFCANAATPWSSLGEAVAIQGYDPVAYFTKNEAVRGNAKNYFEWSGMTWFFASSENRDQFAAMPERFAPQYGGFCTLSVAEGRNARGSGEAWTIHEGKLYLNANSNVAENFRTDPNRHIVRAAGWWPTVKARIEKQ